jgi:regulator of sirC expression with transglutaminase-like and TPR domain
LPTQPHDSSRFSEIISRRQSGIDLFEAALAIAADRYPNLDLAIYREEVDAIGGKVAARMNQASEARTTLLAINSVLFDELGFSGNSADYFDPRNSYLNEVIERRTGIPITLSVLYIEVGNRIGLQLKGVGMPLHFLVKHTGEGEDIFVDPFNGGKLMDADACAEFLANLSGGAISLLPEHLAEVSTEQILIRILGNLAAIYRKRSEYAVAIETIDRILLIDSKCAPYIRDRGSLLTAAQRPKLAADDYERYLALEPNAVDAEAVRARLKELRRWQASLN